MSLPILLMNSCLRTTALFRETPLVVRSFSVCIMRTPRRSCRWSGLSDAEICAVQKWIEQGASGETPASALWVWGLTVSQGETAADAGTSISTRRDFGPADLQSVSPGHYKEWSGRRTPTPPKTRCLSDEPAGQQTNGELGDFCVTCHAPVALMEGLTSDGPHGGGPPTLKG